jgi:RNA polymerase sigma-70 factor (family 1)
MATGLKNMSDEQFLSLIRQKKEEGMKYLFDKYYPELFRFCYKLTGNKEDSEDILQTMFIDLWQNSYNRNIGDLKAYLFKMVKYQVYGYWSGKKDITDLVDDFNEILAIDDVNQIVEKNELERSLSLAVEKLSPACKNVFELSRFDGLSHDEIATKLNISKYTVKNHINKAVKQIKNFLYVNKLLTGSEIIIVFLLASSIYIK